MSDRKNSLKRFSYKEQVSRSITWGHYFIFVNMMLSCLLGLSYIYAAPPATNFLSFVYLVVTSFGHMSFLTVAFYMVLLFPLAFIGNFRYYRIIAVLLTVVGHTALLFDIKIFLGVKVHLSMTALNLIVRELDFNTGLNYNFLFIAVPIVIGLELFFAKITTHSLYRDHHPYAVRSILIALISCFICSHVMHIWADATKYERITLLRSTFPVHYPMTARSFLSSHGWFNNEEMYEGAAANIADYMEYPLGSINVDTEAKPKNVITITLNGLSYSDLSQENTKNFMGFKAYAQSFEEHYLLYRNETDNMYSMNYGLPLQYRRALYSGNILPVPFDAMYRQDYVRRMILSDVSFASEEAANNKRHYYKNLLDAAALRSAQMIETCNAREMFIEAFRQISLYNSYDRRPYELKLVINDLRDFKDQTAQRLSFAKKYNASNADSTRLSSAVAKVKVMEDAANLASQNSMVADDANRASGSAMTASNANRASGSAMSASNANRASGSVMAADEVNRASGSAMASDKANASAELAQSSSQAAAGQNANPADPQSDEEARKLTAQAVKTQNAQAAEDLDRQATEADSELDDVFAGMQIRSEERVHAKQHLEYINAIADARALEFANVINAQAKRIIDADKHGNDNAEEDPAIAAKLMYESTLRHIDALFATFIRELTVSGLLQDTVIIVTSTEGNFMHAASSQVFDRDVQHVPLMILWPNRDSQNTVVKNLTSPQDICATYGASAVNITTPAGNYTLGKDLSSSSGHEILVSDNGDNLILIGKKHNTVYSSDGSSYVERDGRLLQVRPDLESLIESTRDLNRFIR